MPTDTTIDYYRTLGVDSGASGDDIKKAYRGLAKKCHPDSTGGCKAKEARFKEISEAYEVLRDPTKRQQYDATRAGGGQGFPGFNGGATFHGGVGDLGSLFSQVFSSGGSGVEFSFGGGRSPFSGFEETPRRHRKQPPKNRAKQPKPKTRKASDGSIVTQRGADIYSDVRLSIDQAILGCVVSVATLDGAAKVRVPPGSCSGTKLRLKGKGVGTSGSHFVTVQIDVPKKLDEQGEKLLAQLMQRVAQLEAKD